MPNTPTPDLDAPAAGGRIIKKGAVTTEKSAAAPSGDDLQAKLAAAEQRATAAEQNYGKLQTAFGKMSQEVGFLRQRVGFQDNDPSYESEYNDNASAGSRNPAPRSQADIKTLQRLDFVDFRMDNPDWKDHWDEVLKVVEDPFLARSVVAFREDAPNVPDYFVTYSNALRVVKLRKYDEAEVKRKEAQAKLEKDKANVNRLAVSSGVDAGSGEDTVDLDAPGTSADLLKQFPEMISRSDPPSMFRRK